MPIINPIADFTEESAAWRHDFHAHPEPGYEVRRSVVQVAELLTSFGVDEVATAGGRAGVEA